MGRRSDFTRTASGLTIRSRGCRFAAPLNSGVRRQTNMIAIRADDLEIEVSGTVDELREVSLTISALVSSAERSTSLPTSAVDPSPYPRTLTAMTIERSAGQTLVSATHSQLVVSGSDGSLSKFASWFEFPPDVQSGYHSHFEPLPNDPDHSADSVPVVVSVRHAGA